MRCANPDCRASADELLKGTLRLVEFESSPGDRILYPDSGFPVCSARTRFFWLCQTCSRLFTIRRWTSSGLVLEPLPGKSPAFGSSGGTKTPSRDLLDKSESPDRLFGAA